MAISDLTTMTTPLALLRFINDQTSGILFAGFLAVIFLVSWYLTASERTRDKFLVSSFIIAIIGTLFFASELINEQVLGTVWVLAGVSAFYAVWNKE